MEKITAPFTKEQVEKLNKYQKEGKFHPFTCTGQLIEQEDEKGKFTEKSRSVCENEGILIATEEGWVCPCGQYKQDWAHSFMLEDIKRNSFF